MILDWLSHWVFGIGCHSLLTPLKTLESLQFEKDSNNGGFLRLGSFNVKVKKTAEHLGHAKSKSTSMYLTEKLHKGWGSADNIPEKTDDLM
ncbi:hypothetical protein CHUAL_011390 [Chamberlinius hualienensis]